MTKRGGLLGFIRWPLWGRCSRSKIESLLDCRCFNLNRRWLLHCCYIASSRLIAGERGTDGHECVVGNTAVSAMTIYQKYIRCYYAAPHTNCLSFLQKPTICTYSFVNSLVRTRSHWLAKWGGGSWALQSLPGRPTTKELMLTSIVPFSSFVIHTSRIVLFFCVRS